MGDPHAMRHTHRAMSTGSPPHGEAMPAQPVLTARWVWRIVLVVAAAAVLGIMFGTLVGRGRVNIHGLDFIGAGGDGVPALLFSALFAAIAGLIVALIGTRRSVTPPSPRMVTDHVGIDASGGRQPSHAASHQPMQQTMQPIPPPWLMQLPTYGTTLAAAFMLYTLYLIAARGIGAGAPSDQQGRVTWNEKNVTRLGGRSDAATAPAAWAAATPAWSGAGDPPGARHVAADWRIALASTPLIAAPTNAVIIPDTPGAAPDAPAFAAAFAAAVDSMRGRTSAQVLLVAVDADPAWALPAAAYAARTGAPILFVSRSAVPTATRAALAARAGHAAMLLLAPSGAISDGVVRTLASYGHLDQVSGATPTRAAIRFAEFRDQVRDLGWGRTGRGRQRYAEQATILVNPTRWQDVIAAAHLARRGKSGPIVYARAATLPAATAAYLWRLRPAFAETPEEGPYSHAWVVGSFARIGYLAQARADYAQEISEYMTLGDSAISGFEALAIAWILLALASAIWVWDSAGRVHGVMPMMRAGWTSFTVLFGPIGAVMYARSYHRRPHMMHDIVHDGPGGPMPMWERPTGSKVLSATVMMFGFDMLLMCLAVFAIGYVGYPIIRATNPLYWMGTSMFLMMILMYVVALILMMLVFHGPMTMHERGVPYARALRLGFPMMLATMTVESVGMMPTMWWAQMHYLPAMQMPTTDDITMWATLLMSVAVAFVIVLPFNYAMVRRGAKMGMM